MAPGARSKFGAPMFEPEVFRKQMYCTEVVTLLWLFGAPQSFSALIVIWRPDNCAPCPPLITARSDAPQQIMVHTSNQRHTGTMGFRRGKIFISPEFLRHFEEKRIGEFCRAMVQFQKFAQKYREVSPEFFWSCPNLPPLRTPIALTQKLWQNTSYLQLSGLNNWFYVVITIFALHLNMCSPKLVEWRRLSPQPGDASGNS